MSKHPPLTREEALILVTLSREPGLATGGIVTRTGLSHRDVLVTAETLTRMRLIERRREVDPEYGTLSRRHWLSGEAM